MKDWERTLITPETILLDALDLIYKPGSRIALIVDAGFYLFKQLIAGCTAPLFYSSRLVKLFSSFCLNLPISKNNHCTNKL
jgi:hypothetical protein